MGMSVTFVSVFGTSLNIEDLFCEKAQAMRELSELVEAAQSGDGEAYDALIQRFQQMAYATAYRYLGDHHLAQDLVQEAMIEAFVHLPQLKEPVAFPGWFHRTETNPRLRREAHHALKHQDPNYRALVDAQARERGIVQARARKEQQLLRQSIEESAGQ
jgi:RNA polymerase sigma factor (sigma-70 family)